MLKILFLIHDLGQGGAEKVLVNLVNHLDFRKYDVSVIALFGGGVNEQFLSDKVHYKAIFPKMFPGNSKIMKLFTPKQLHRMFVKEQYDIEISYLEGPSARIISGCGAKATKLISWIHVEQHDMRSLANSFRNAKEARECYNRFDQIVCVSEYVKNDFTSILNYKKTCDVVYNTVESEKILADSVADAHVLNSKDQIRLIAVGTLKASKGYERLMKIILRLKEEGYPIHLYVLGIGSMKSAMELYIEKNNLEEQVTLLGYDTNPYKYVSKCDLFVCASYTEGFSTAATEALIVGTPVCTVEVSGMKEMLGENNEYGLVTENSEEGLYRGIKTLLDEPELLSHYKQQALTRGKMFRTEETVRAVEEMLDKIAKEDIA